LFFPPAPLLTLCKLAFIPRRPVVIGFMLMTSAIARHSCCNQARCFCGVLASASQTVVTYQGRRYDSSQGSTQRGKLRSHCSPFNRIKSRMTTHRIGMLRPTRLGRLRASMWLLFALSAIPAVANEVEEVARLMRAGSYARSLQIANAYLEQFPRDPQMRFLKGVILTEQNRRAEAINLFTQLTQDYPEMAEPYNNLAVLWASIGQHDAARTALERAIRINPSYTTAYENLGDVYIKLAIQAYENAAQSDRPDPATKNKLALTRSLITNAGIGNAHTPASLAAAGLPIDPPVAAAMPPVDRDSDSGEVLDIVNAWAAAWSAMDVDEYLGFYSKNFVPPKRQSRQAWAKERRARIIVKARIHVSIASPQVQVNGDKATIRFRQISVSNGVRDETRKTILLNRQHGQWQIVEERGGS
jgi:tetratricopeptide (TPR) repeat protein